MATLNLTQLDNQALALVNAVVQSARKVNNDPDLTTDGKRKQLEGWANQYKWRDIAAALTRNIERAVDAAKGLTADAAATYLPTADPADTNARMLAEMEAQRLLSRRTKWEIDAAFILARDVDPSPGRTLALEELEARGVITHDQMLSMIPGTAETRRVAGSIAAALAEIGDGVTQAVQVLDGTRSPQSVTYRSMMPFYIEREAIPATLDVATAAPIDTARAIPGASSFPGATLSRDLALNNGNGTH